MAFIISILKEITVEPYQFLYMLSSHMSYGVFQDLLYKKICLNEYHSPNICGVPIVNKTVASYIQEESARWLRYCSIAEYIPALIALCLIGSYSDLKGRKIPMLIPALGAVFSNLCYLFLSIYAEAPIALFLLPNTIDGITGSYLAVNVAVMCYIANYTSVAQRTWRIAVVEAMTFIGATVGPLISRAMMSKTKHAGIFLFLVAVNSAAVIYVIVRIVDIKPRNSNVKNSRELTNSVEEFDAPKDGTTDDDAASDGRGDSQEEDENLIQDALRRDLLPKKSNKGFLNGLEFLISSFVTCFKARKDHDRMHILLLMLAFGVLILSSEAESSTTLLFLYDAQLSWKFEQYSLYSSIKQGLASLAVLIGIPVFHHLLPFNLKDVCIAVIGYVSRTSGSFFLAFSVNSIMVYIDTVISMFRYYPTPVIRSMLSKLVEPSEHGRIMTVLSVIDVLCALLGSVLFSTLYASTREIFHGFCFFVSGFIILVSAGLVGLFYFDSWKIRRRVREEEHLNN